MPSLAFSAESDEALKQLLTTAPQSPSDSKAKSVENYSPVVDLRTNPNLASSRAQIETWNNWKEGTITWDQSTVLDVNNGLAVENVANYNVRNNAVITINSHASGVQDPYGLLSSSVLLNNCASVFFRGNGTFVINSHSDNETLAFLGSNSRWWREDYNLDISSRFIFHASGNLKNFLHILGGPTGYRSGIYRINSPYVEIDMSKSTNAEKNVLGGGQYYAEIGIVLFNAQENSPQNYENKDNILKLTGDLKSVQSNLYAHFTNSDSFLKGDIVNYNRKSIITFSNNAKMIGNIDAQGNGNHSITFDSASFIGVAKNTASNNNGNNGVNTTITFKNTAGKTFGSTTDGVVDSSYKGTIIGSFDVSANSATIINGGTNGDKGFFGSGTNTLTFDFRNNASTGLSAPSFTIGGGNANSVYVMNAFQAKGQTALDLSSLSANGGSLFSKIKNAGIAIKESTQIQNGNNTNNVLQGTLLFKNTNIKVGDNGNALFATKGNILATSSNDLNGLALGAMFGNATWNDANKDGYITSDEITANAGGANYKLSTSPAVQSRTDSSNTDDRTSTGNIGNTNDNVKKQIGFIFANGTETNQGYEFGGDKQGYSGIIKGGTDDSKYYFANAGYVNRTQIEDAKGDLVLFNTAFRGDLGVKNKDVSIMLDFSENRNGLRAETGNDNANIVGAGSKNITFNFTGNTKKDKYVGAVVGDATKGNANGGSSTSGGTQTDSDTATYTMLNLVKYSADNTIADNNGALSANANVRGERTSKTLIDALQQSGLTNFNKQDAEQLKAYTLPNSQQPANREGSTSTDSTTNVELLSKTNTTLALRGTSLDANGISFKDYIYDFAFGTNIGEIEGITIEDSKLKGTIDLSQNNNTGHKIVMRGDSIEGEAEIKFNSNSGNANFGVSKGGVFVYDDYTATRSASSTPTLKLSGLSQTNYLTTGSGLDISKTNFEGDIWMDNSSAVNLDFRDGRTWKMNESGIYLKSGSSIVIHGNGNVVSPTSDSTTPPTLKLAVDSAQDRIELINTGMTLKLLDKGHWNENKKLANSFAMRGTSLNTYWNTNFSGSSDGFHGYADSGVSLVFAKGTNLQTNVAKPQKDGTSATYYKITDEGVNTGYVNGEKLNHTGNYVNGIYDGNYIAESTSSFTKLVTRSINAVFVGEDSYNDSNWGDGGNITQTSSFAFINAGTNTKKLDGSKIVKLLTTQNPTTTVILEGTSLRNSANGIVAQNKGATTFNMTFVNDGNNGKTGNTENTYVDISKYGEDLGLTNANGALSDSVLKVAQSKLEDGIDFGSSNFNVLFVGDASQSLDGTGSNSSAKVFKGGSASSIVTFRDSNLNAGNSTSSSLQNIKGTIAFDLSHNDEDMQISGTLSNMFGNGSNTAYNGTGKYQTKFGEARGDQADGLSFDKLVFVKLGSNSGQSGQANTLTTLKTNGNYFNDTDTFGSLANTDYSTIGYIKDLDTTQNSSLTLAGNSTVALNGANQEIVFIGADSHGFDDTASTSTSPGTQAGGSSVTPSVSKLGDSTGSTLTFIDAGELKVANIQNGKGTINLIGSTRIETQTLSASSSGSSSSSASSPSAIAEASGTTKTLTLYKAGTTTTAPSVSTLTTSTSTSAITGKGITINAVFTGTNALEASSNGIQTSGGNGQAINNGHKASTANIGQVGEQTIYHILFDYTSSGLTFGTHHAYTGNIYGLTSESIIKFKNAGYINNTQIENTQATILLDNTQLKGDFRGDVAILDFRNNRPAISGNILTSDMNDQVASRKLLTFDLTGSNSSLNYQGTMQVGTKIAPDYSEDGDSKLTFQNYGSTISLHEGALKGLTQAGFKGLAQSFQPFARGNDKPVASSIDTRTTFAFEGIDISGDSSSHTITENAYNLELKFDNRHNDSARGQTGLGEVFRKSKLTANSITMGNSHSLSLSFAGAGSLAGATVGGVTNVLSVNLAGNARFNLDAKSYDQTIGTIVFNGSRQTRGFSSLPSFTPPALNVSTDSSLSINLGSMGFVGDFIQAENTPSGTSTAAGSINVKFGDNANANSQNKVYGTLAGRGEMVISINGDALFDKDTAKTLGYDGRDQGVNLLIDASNATSSNITLAHSSGTVEVKGKALQNQVIDQTQLTNLSINNAQSHVALDGAFNIGKAGLSFDANKKLMLSGDTALFVSQTGKNDNSTITIAEGGFEAKTSKGTPLNLIINAMGRNQTEEKVNLNLTNLGDQVLVVLTSNDGSAGNNNKWNKSTWNIRGTSLFLKNSFTADKGSFNLVFANGVGTETTQTTQTSQDKKSRTPLTLDQLEGADKIALSTFGNGTSSIAYNSQNNQDTRSIALESARFTFIGKEANNQDNLRVDSVNSGKVTFNYYNSIIKSGTVTLDNTRNNSNSSQEVATILGTDTFNLSAVKQGSGWGSGTLNSTINAVFVNGSNLTTTAQQQAPSTPTILTGNTYINAENGANKALKTTLAQYATSNAGGALSENILKTLESKAYGNITMDNTVTANMKFIGENSHSFDGKTAVYQGADGQYGTADDEFYYNESGTNVSNGSSWKKLTINEGMVSVGNDTMNGTNNASNSALATLKGGNANSRFDFDHTTVALDLVKFAGGKTIVYNSTVSGQIAVKANGGVGNGGSNTIASTSSTTLFFNAKMTEKAQNGSTLSTGSADQELTDIAKKYIDYHYTSAETGLGINLDLSNAHTLKAENLTAGSTGGTTGSTGSSGSAGGATVITDPASSTPNKVLANTEKKTNLVFIGKDSVETGNGTKSDNSGASIDISFMPSSSTNYSYTFIGAGEFTSAQIKANGDFNGSVSTPTDPSGAELTVFGTSKVTLVDTYVVGERNFAQVGFIDTNESRNQKSSWGGNQGIEQFLIFDFHNGANNQELNSKKGNVITNTDANSRYIFTSIFSQGTADSKRVLTLSNGTTTLKQAINAQLKTTQKSRVSGSGQNVIGSNVKGYLGLRGVSIKGDINESTGSGNNVDIVFNSTSNISYIDGFDESGKHTFEIKDIGANKVANITGIDTDISGYAVLMSNNGSEVTIKGNASKDIVFIGEGSVEGGFDKLKIEGGSATSNYTFYEVGELSQTFLDNVGLHKNDTAKQDAQQVDMKATLGNFTFANSTIIGDINVNESSVTPFDVNGGNKLVFDNVAYSGTLSGNLTKELKFAKGSNNINIKGGNDASIYDFSNLSGESIALNIDLSDNDKYLTSTITGFDGDVSLVGSIKLAKHHRETTAGATYTNSFAFNNNAKWTMTDNSRVMNLSLSNTGTSFNLDLSSAPRSSNAVMTQDGNTQSTPNTDLRVLEVGNLSSNGGQVLLGTQIDTQTQANSKSDKIKASVISSGTLYITAKDATLATGSFSTQSDQAIVLVTADTAYGEVKGAERKEGLSYVSTELEHQVSSNSGTSWDKATEENEVNSTLSHRWVLSGFDSKVNQELVDESGFIVSNPYRMLVIETNNLNKRMGDLRDNDYNQGSWIRVFNGSDSGEGAKNLYTNIQLGYDYGTPAIGAKNYTGVAFSTSIVDIDGNQYSGKANTYSLGVYNAYIADSGLYVDTIAKYLYTDQKLTPSGSSDSSFGSHALSLGVEVGYRAYMGESNFYFETQAEAIGGVIFGVKDIDMGIIGGRDINGELKTTTALNTRVGLVQGYSLKTENGFRADFRLGASLVNEFVSEANPVMLYDGITEASTSIGNDTKVVLNVGTNLILTDQWRVYIDAERSFGGSRNVDYQANIGARFSFGDKISSLPKPSKPLPLKTSENKNNK